MNSFSYPMQSKVATGIYADRRCRVPFVFACIYVYIYIYTAAKNCCCQNYLQGGKGKSPKHSMACSLFSISCSPSGARAVCACLHDNLAASIYFTTTDCSALGYLLCYNRPYYPQCYLLYYNQPTVLLSVHSAQCTLCRTLKNARTERPGI